MNDIEVLEDINYINKILKDKLSADEYGEVVVRVAIIRAELKERQSDKERIKDLLEERDLYRSQVNSAFDRGFIHISKIEEMLEELDKEEKELQDSISEEEREEYSDANISFDLMHIEIQRRVLKKLLKENR